MKWVSTKQRLPEEGRQAIFDGGEAGVILAGVKQSKAGASLVVYDSSGEESYEDISPYYQWLDEREKSDAPDFLFWVWNNRYRVNKRNPADIKWYDDSGNGYDHFELYEKFLNDDNT